MKVLSLFSGAGGLDLGLIQAGNTVIWANDIDANAVETYKKNIGTHIVLGDIKNIDISKLPKADVVVGGFPCQGFSQANRFRMLDDERNALYKFFYEVIHEKQPYFFIAENVKGILSLGKGGAIKQIISDFEAAGYYTDLHLVNMADYGVPETRQRVIIIGQRHDLGKDLLFKFPIPTHSKEGENGLKRWVTIAEAIDHFPDPDLRNEIIARGNGGGGVCAIPHYNGKRRLTVRESASVQTFPEDFEFFGVLGSCYRQIGNAVPVLFARLLGQELMRIEKEEKL